MAMNRMLVRIVIGLLLASALPCATAGASASGAPGDRGSRERVFADRVISLDEAVARAERRYNARAVRAEERRHGERVEYRIRLLAEDGRVFEVRIDAASGRED